ncbi:PspA/IM30 family protein [Cytophagaceae bacterium ABcell3]|nr:PspA/IM30 family protein [Cytophagaceae bacterium ABcell3]
MFNWLKRLFMIGGAEAHKALDKLEDPVNMIEQGIRDLKEDLNKGLKSLAEVKALAIKAQNDQKSQTNSAREYEEKAVLLLKKAQTGGLDPTEADRLASEALMKQQAIAKQVEAQNATIKQYQEMAAQIESNNNLLKKKIDNYESELGSLKARVKVAKSTKDFNKSMAGLDSNETLRMLERMKDKISHEEALAQSYGAIAESKTSIDDQINRALEGATVNPEVKDSLAELKAKLGMDKKLEE